MGHIQGCTIHTTCVCSPCWKKALHNNSFFDTAVHTATFMSACAHHPWTRAVLTDETRRPCSRTVFNVMNMGRVPRVVYVDLKSTADTVLVQSPIFCMLPARFHHHIAFLIYSIINHQYTRVSRLQTAFLACCFSLMEQASSYSSRSLSVWCVIIIQLFLVVRLWSLILAHLSTFVMAFFTLLFKCYFSQNCSIAIYPFLRLIGNLTIWCLAVTGSGKW